MIRLGVFYCLESDLKREVDSIKTFFSSKNEISKYLNHLSHSTIYVFDIESNKINDVIFEFEDLQKSLIQLPSHINKWRVFENDILTSLNTLCLEIELTNEPKVLQMNTVEYLCKFHLQNKNINFEGDLKFSNNKYGYPFVGNHWIPHITIGSINISKEKLLNYTKGLLTFPKEIKINNLGLYKIEGDSHQLLKKIYF